MPVTLGCFWDLLLSRWDNSLLFPSNDYGDSYVSGHTVDKLHRRLLHAAF